MARIKLDMPCGYSMPKRGDLVYTNLNRPRMIRLWIVLGARRMKPTVDVGRCCVWLIRWWEIEPDLRMRLFHSAERNGGQRYRTFVRYPIKKKPTFEQFMRRERGD